MNRRIALACLVVLFGFWMCVPTWHAFSQVSSAACLEYKPAFTSMAEGRFAWFSC